MNKGKVKSSQPSLRKTRDKRPLGQELVSLPYYEYDKAFLVPWASVAAYKQGEKFSA
jgi:hypothetical protein